MRAPKMRLRRRLLTEIWFIPMMSLIGASLFAIGTIAIDRRVIGTDALQGLFARNPEGIRTALSVVASSILTFTALVFTITMVVVQQAANRLSPRVITSFLRDRMSQATLGMFLGTFAYSLLVLRAIRSSDDAAPFIPGISVAIVFLAVFASLGLFIAYLHHTSSSLQVNQIAFRIARETDEAIDSIYPEDGEEPADVPAIANGAELHWPGEAGYLQEVDGEALAELAVEHDCVIEVLPVAGDFVPRSGHVARASRSIDVEDSRLERVMSVEQGRSVDNDVAFGFRQLVDIGEMALSTGVNDPTTAVEVLDRIHDLLRKMVKRPVPRRWVHLIDGEVRAVIPGLSLEGYLALATEEIAQYGKDSIQVSRRIDAMLEDLAHAAPGSRLSPLPGSSKAGLEEADRAGSP